MITQPFSFEALRCSYEDNQNMLEIINDMQFDIKMLAKLTPYAAVNYILKGIGYEDYIEEEITAKRLNREEVYGKLEELKQSLRKYTDIKQWLLYIHEQSEEQKQQSYNKYNNHDRKKTNKSDAAQHDAINIYTMHGCKGLEFKAVFITDVCEGIIPYNKALLDSQIEEERRLMYVAMTRAKEKLYLVYPKKRYGQDTAMSRFISEASV